MPTICFWVAVTNKYQYQLRRYCSLSDGAEKCPAGSYHNAVATVGIVEFVDHPTITSVDIEDFKDGEQWPTHCDSCGVKLDYTHNQRWYNSIYRSDDGREWPIRDLPPGAMYHAEWRDDIDKSLDGKALAVILPDRQTWFIDSTPTNGGKWTRSGIIPKITVSPSILTPNYHGFLRNGVLTDDIDKRKNK